MTDTWVTPRVWVAGEKVTASKKNEDSNNFRVLWPYTTAGDMVYRDAAGAYLTRFAKPTVDSVLKNTTAGIPSWLELAGISGFVHTSGMATSGTLRTTSSTTFVDVTGAGFNLTLTKTCTVIAFAYGYGYTTNGAQYPSLGISINGTDDAVPIQSSKSPDFTNLVPFTTMNRQTGVAAGTRAIQLRFKIASAADAMNVQFARVIALAIVE
jgi:hypothetical protein